MGLLHKKFISGYFLKTLLLASKVIHIVEIIKCF
jgi:hypothetical protein